MQESTFFIYSDASFSKKHTVGFGGYLIFSNQRDHESGNVSSASLVIEKIDEKNNIRVELKSAIMALMAIESMLGEKNRCHINLYTDCKSIVGLLERRERLEVSGYVSKRTGNILANADLYRQFFLIYDKLHPQIYWVKGHSPNQAKNIIEKNFSFVDKAVRKAIRKHCSVLGYSSM